MLSSNIPVPGGAVSSICSAPAAFAGRRRAKHRDAQTVTSIFEEDADAHPDFGFAFRRGHDYVRGDSWSFVERNLDDVVWNLLSVLLLDPGKHSMIDYK